MDSDQKPTTRTKHPDRVTLSPEALARLGAWMEELGGHLKGNRVTRSDLVNFLILSHPPQLSEKELSDLASQHFDEVRFAEWAVRQIKEAKALGRELTLADIIKGKAPKSEGNKVAIATSDTSKGTSK